MKNDNIYTFFRELAQNNNRDWFTANKSRYQALRQQWIDQITRALALVADDAPELRNLDPARSTYRIYRDLRFSPDKTPYKTNIGTYLAPGGASFELAGVYVQATNDHTSNGIFAGIWCPSAPNLRKLRRAIDENSEEFLDIVQNPDFHKNFTGPWAGDALVTAPKGYPKDHPLIEYLRLKNICKTQPLTPDQIISPDFPETLAASIRVALPLLRFINYTLTEE